MPIPTPQATAISSPAAGRIVLRVRLIEILQSLVRSPHMKERDLEAKRLMQF